jgi:hypothetical protein
MNAVTLKNRWKPNSFFGQITLKHSPVAAVCFAYQQKLANQKVLTGLTFSGYSQSIMY